MRIEFAQEPLGAVKVAAVAVYAFESSPLGGSVEALPAAARALVEELKSSGEFTGKPFECSILHHPAGLAAARLLVVGAGKKEKFNSAQARKVAGAAVRFARAKGAREVAWVSGDAECIQAAVEGAILGDYDADRYRTERESERRIDRLVLVTDGPTPEGSGPQGDAARSQAAREAAERGRIIAEAQNFTRDLVNEPSNRMTPTDLAARAEAMAKRFGLECQVLGPEEIRAQKMGAFWAVAQGSDEPPRLIVLRYAHPQAPAVPVIGLIGKGITFDTGGISIKPSEAMHEMKTDMAGGASMLGAMQAIAQLKPRARVVAVVPATENMPSGKAYKPGDVITSMSGKTIEILNTDAEGRLVLADALTYAKQLGCTVLIDVATLTGAVTIALGNITTGVFGTSQEWIDRVLASARAAGDRMWQMPVDDEYRELYKSMIADIANTGGRHGGAITGAMFIGEFAGDTPWVHLDIAGTRWSYEEKPYLAKGPTGHPVRTLVHLVISVPA